jgi:tetratricopeptide (TPR) repeat protein
MRRILVILCICAWCAPAVILAESSGNLSAGADLLEAGKIDGALMYFKKSLKEKDTDTADLHLLLGAIYNMQGKYSKAAEELKEAQKLQPVIGEGIALMFGEAYRDALNRSDSRAYKNLPGNLSSRAFFALGALMRRAKIWDKAIAAYRVAAVSDPEFRFLREEAIATLYKYAPEIGAYKGAREEYEKITDSCPTAFNYLALASMYSRQDFAKTKTFIEKAVGIAPIPRQVYLDAAQLYIDTGHYDDGMAFAGELLRRRPNSADAHMVAGMIAVSSGKYEDAMGYYKDALTLDPQDPLFHHDLCLVYMVLHKWKEALGEYAILADRPAEVLSFDPAELATAIVYGHYFGTDKYVTAEGGRLAFSIPTDNAVPEDKRKGFFSCCNRAFAHEQRGEYAQAIEAWKDALKEIETVAAHLGLGSLYLKSRDSRKDAEYHFTRAMALAKANLNTQLCSHVYQQVAFLYLAGQDYKAARAVLEEFLQEHPLDILAMYRLENLYFYSGDWDNTRAMAERIKDQDKVVFELIARDYAQAQKQHGLEKK